MTPSQYMSEIAAQLRAAGDYGLETEIVAWALLIVQGWEEGTGATDEQHKKAIEAMDGALIEWDL